MADNFIQRFFQKRISELEGGTFVASPRSEENGGWPDLTPFDYVWTNGVFRSSVDGSMTAFFKLKGDVRTEWLGSREQLIDNQYFFNRIVEELAEKLNTGIMSKTKDRRREVELAFMRSKYKQLHRDKNDTPATVHYRDRMGENVMRPEWSGYMGVQLLPGSLFEDSASFQEFGENYVETFKDPLRYYLSDYRMVKETLESYGLEALSNFTVDSADYKNLTAWHGVDVEAYRKDKSLSTTRFQEPVDGYSLITEAWDEVTFYAAVPMKQRADFGEDPISEAAQWGKELFNPSNDVVGIWIKGEIRGREVIKEILNNKSLGRKNNLDKVDENKYADVEQAQRDLMITKRGEEAASQNDFIDNMEILICVQDLIGVDNPLRKHLRSYGMDALLPVNRQADCLVSTIPGSKKRLSRIRSSKRQSNFTRGQFSCQAFPGAISMSGILRKTRPCAPNGILIGLTDGDNERREVFTRVDAAKTANGSPVMIVAGRSGSGKALRVDTPVVTPTGYIPIGKVEVGDIVVDAEGAPCRVVDATDVYEARECWKVTTDRGVVFCDEHHQWPVIGLSRDVGVAGRRLVDIAQQADNSPVSAQDLAVRLYETVSDLDCSGWFSARAIEDSLRFTDCVCDDKGRWGYRDALYVLMQRMGEIGTLSSYGEDYRKITVRDMVRLQGEGECNFLMPGFGREDCVVIRSIERCEDRPLVKCISVDSPTRCYMVKTDSGDVIPTGNTQSVLQYCAQGVYDNRAVVMLNPKKDGTLQAFFDHLDGVTISMNDDYLSENPGMLDPFNFFEDRQRIGKVLSGAIVKYIGFNTDKGSAGRVKTSAVMASIADNVLDSRNTCSFDVIFGNRMGREMYPRIIDEIRDKHNRNVKGFELEVDTEKDLPPVYVDYVRNRLSEMGGTPPITSVVVRNFMRDQLKVSAFWKTILSENMGKGSDIRDKMSTGRPILIEWDGSLTLPSVETPESEYQPSHLESVISVSLAFQYAEFIISKGGRGGLLVTDEAWVLKKSKEARDILNRGSREWRQSKVMPILVTQRISDYLDKDDDNLTASVERFLFMATPANDELERELFFRITGLENTDANWNYMVNAGVRDVSGKVMQNPVARGYYVDNIYGFSSGITAGPWPAEELTLGRTDAEGEALREKMLDKGIDSITDDEWREAGGYVLSVDDFLRVVRNKEEEEPPAQGGLDRYTAPDSDPQDMWNQKDAEWS